MNNLQQFTNEFIRHCQLEKTLSAKTIKAYSTDITQWLTFTKSLDGVETVMSITKEHVRAYLETITHLKPKSIKRKIATLKALFNFMEFEDRINSNPFRKMRINIRDNKVLPTVMTLNEISRILKVAYKKKDQSTCMKGYAYFAALRDVVVLELLFATGARVSEIASLPNDNIDVATGNIVLKGKGNKERIIHVCNKEALSILQLYVKHKRELNLTAANTFFINRLNRPYTDQSIRNLVKKFVAAAGLSKRITPHTFRHSFATLLLEKEVDIKYIQSLLGHSSIITTQIYTHVNREKQKQILRTKHPRRDLVLLNHHLPE